MGGAPGDGAGSGVRDGLLAAERGYDHAIAAGDRCTVAGFRGGRRGPRFSPEHSKRGPASNRMAPTYTVREQTNERAAGRIAAVSYRRGH